jgi:hypothetical protein
MMLERIRTVDGETLLPLPADVLATIGFQPDDRGEVAVVQSLVVQLPPAERFIESEFNQIFQDVMQTRRNAYRKLA